jgi:hypothetical protein
MWEAFYETGHRCWAAKRPASWLGENRLLAPDRRAELVDVLRSDSVKNVERRRVVLCGAGHPEAAGNLLVEARRSTAHARRLGTIRRRRRWGGREESHAADHRGASTRLGGPRPLFATDALPGNRVLPLQLPPQRALTQLILDLATRAASIGRPSCSAS